MAHIVKTAEITADLGIGLKSPVVKHPGEVPVDPNRFLFFDDQRAVKTPGDLLEPALVRVIPVRSGIRNTEFVSKAFTRRDRFLRQVGYAVHYVRDAKTMPMDCGFFIELVVDGNTYPVSLPDADFSSRHLAVIGPDCGFWIALAC